MMSKLAKELGDSNLRMPSDDILEYCLERVLKPRLERVARRLAHIEAEEHGGDTNWENDTYKVILGDITKEFE